MEDSNSIRIKCLGNGKIRLEVVKEEDDGRL